MAIFTKANIDSQDPEQRIKALEKMDNQEDKTKILEILLQDSDLKVKEFALSKLDDPELLAENLANFSTNMQMASSARIVKLLEIDLVDMQIKKNALTKVAQLLTQIPKDTKEEKIPATILINFIFDALIQEYENAEVSLFILELIKGLEIPAVELEAWFTKIAVGSSIQEVRLQALEYVTSEESLQKILNCAKKHKKVKKTAQEKLHKIKQERLESEEFAEKCRRLALAARELSLSAYDKLFANRFEYLQKSWLEVSFKASFKDKELFESCMQDIQARISAEEQIQFAAAEAKQNIEKVNASLETIEELTEEIGNSKNLTQEELKSILQKIDELEEEYRILPNVELELTQKFNESVANLRKYIQTIQAVFDKQTQLQDLLDKEDENSIKEAEQILRNLNFSRSWKKPEEIKDIFDQVFGSKKNKKISETKANSATENSKLENSANRQNRENLTKVDFDKLNKNIIQLESFLQEGKLRDAIKLSNQLKDFFQLNSKARIHKQEQKFKILNRRLFELKKWQDSIAHPKRIEICEQLEILAQDDQMDLTIKAEKIKHLQQNWHDLGADGQSRNLWERYKKASDLAYTPCKEFISNKIEQKRFNAEQKITICNELELLLEQDFFAIKTNDYFQIISEAKRQWRFYTPITEKDYKKLNPRYLELLAQLAEKRDQVNKQIRTLKLEILDKSKELLESETTKAEDFKKLKQAWFDIDFLPRKEERIKFEILQKRIGAFYDKNQALREKEAQEQKLQENRLNELVEILAQKLELSNLDKFTTAYKEFENLFREANGKTKSRLQKTSMALKDKFDKVELWTNFTAGKPIGTGIASKEQLTAQDILARIKVIAGGQNIDKSEQLKLQIARLQQRKSLHIKDDFTEVCLLLNIWQNLKAQQKQKQEQEQEQGQIQEQEQIQEQLTQVLQKYCLDS